jgi:hypothetical protein
MRQYIISYDLYRPGHNYSDLSTAIKRLGQDWDQPLANLWIIDTHFTANEIRAILSNFLVAGDKLYIREGGGDLAGIDISLGAPLEIKAVSSATRAPVKLLDRVLPETGAALAESRMLTGATAESW